MKGLTIFGLSILLISFHGFSDKHRNTERRNYAGKPGSETTISIDSRISQVVLKTANGCGIGNFLIPCTGDTSQGTPPLIGSITYNGSNYTYNVLDTVPGTHIKGVAFKRSWWWPPNTTILSAHSPAEPYVVVSDIGMFSYSFDETFSPQYGSISKLDSLFIPGILKMAKQITTDATNPIVLLVQDTISTYRIRVYSYPNLLEQFSFAFHFEPEIFEVIENALFITGWDTSGTYMLYHFSSLQDTLYASYPMNDFASNAQEFLKIRDSLFVLSSPGDSITVLTTLKTTDSTLSQSVVYPHSGARATYNEYKNHKNFTFQPTDSVLDKQILVLDPANAQVIDTLMINHSLDWFKHPTPVPDAFGYFSMGWIGARWGNGINDSVFVSDAYATSVIQIEAGAFPQHINATYGCWVGVPENELEAIKFEVYPNPASSIAVINLTGLKKDRQYTLTISDMSGRVYYTTYLKAYQEINLPLGDLSDGVYMLNLDTGRNIITKKLVIQ
ncbi:MAG: T9SS type A sorting domain-containing protein [Bacteroidia bacterium]